jgi:hypothetical protein
MIQRIKWIDRKFEFNQPAGLFPMTLERLRGAPIRLSHFTGNLPKTVLTKKDGKAWSIQEHVGHLIDLEELHEGRIDDFLAGKTTLRAADMQNVKTNEANHNNADIKDLLYKFTRLRTNYIDRLEGLDEAILLRTSIHPRLNIPMRPVDMALFTAEHDDQHIAIIHELLSA